MKNDGNETETMTIREMCDMFDVTARTLRFYESKELLSPQRLGQKRLYSSRERARLKLILRGKRFGLDLEKIRQLLNLYNMADSGQAQMAHSLEVAQERFVDLTEQRDDLNLVLEELAVLIKWCRSEIPSGVSDKTSTA